MVYEASHATLTCIGLPPSTCRQPLEEESNRRNTSRLTHTQGLRSGERMG